MASNEDNFLSIRNDPSRELQYPQRSLRFEYATPIFEYENIEFQTQLIGFDPKWSHFSEETAKEYSNLSEGSYIFQVRAQTPFGDKTTIASYAFTILPPWYRTWWAYTSYAILTILLIYAIVAWRLHHLRERTEELESLVKERTIDLERANMELARANDAKNEFLANMSHEIRNPMNGIVGLVRILWEGSLQREQREQVQLLRKCSTYLKDLLTEILDFAAIEKGHIKIQTRPFSFPEVTQTVQGLYQEQAHEKGLRINVENASGFPARLEGDAFHLQQVLVNLVSNAIKFTEEGSVTIKLDYQFESDHSARIQLSVIDTGRGIPKEKQEEIFEKFAQLKQKDDAIHQGAGLGLAISQELIHAMGGALGVTSEEGKGSCFTIKLALPVLNKEAYTRDHDPNRKIPQFNAHVLLVEDHEYNRVVAGNTLRKFGCTVDTACDGIEGLDKMKTNEYDVVFSDVDMPRMNGLEMTEKFRTEEDVGEMDTLNIVAMTAYSAEKDRKNCMKAGMDAFINKPFEEDELCEILETFIDTPPTYILPHRPQDLDTLSDDIDIRALIYLGNNDPEKEKQQLLLFTHTVEEAIADIKKAMLQKNYETLHTTAHQCISTVRIIKAKKLESIFRELSEAARSKKVDPLDKLFEELTKSWEITAPRIHDALKDRVSLT